MFWKMQCALALLALLLVSCSEGQRSERRKSPIQSVPVSADVKKAVDFDCPEEFGYYPHPTDCSQYYVCVFGGALLESCTGGLMYSNELQTCDWPRNVGCSATGEHIETPRVQQQQQQQQRESHNPQRESHHPQRESHHSQRESHQQHRESQQPQQVPVQVSRSQQAQRAPAPQPQSQRIRVQAQPPPPPPRPSPNPVVTSRGQPTHINHQEIVKQLNDFQQQLYADVDEQLPPAEEIENDTQQRVLRGQPSSLGAVQRDRDGLSPNTIRQGKVGAFSFGTQVDRDEILQNYSDLLTDLTDVIEPPNSIDDGTDNESEKQDNEIIRKKRETAEDRAFNVDENDDRDKRQVRYGRVQQGNRGNQNNVNLRWNEEKKKNTDFVQFPSAHHNVGQPFKPSAQIGDGFSPLTGSAINIQKIPSNSQQFKNHQSSDDTFKPIIKDSAKQYSNSVPNFSTYSSTPNYAYFTLNSQDSKSTFPLQSTTAAPIFKENFQYFSLKSEPSITKSPPISSLKSPSQSPFAALSGGFYNNKPSANIHYNTKVKSPNHSIFTTKQPLVGSSLQYDYEVGSKRPSQQNQVYFISTPSSISDFKPKNPAKPSRLPPVRNSSRKPRPQHIRPSSASYDVNNNKGSHSNIVNLRQPKLRPDQYREYSSTSPKYSNNNNNNNHNNKDNNSNNNNHNNQDDEEEDDESEEEEEGDGDESEGAVKNNQNQEQNEETDDGEDIRPEFPEPPGHYIQPVNKYEDIVNPFADPNFDFDSFISKVRNNHLSNVGPKVVENLNSQIKNNEKKPLRHNHNEPISHTPRVRNEFLNDHHKYDGMSTPRPFSSSSVSWPANTNSHKIIKTPKPTSSSSHSDDYEDEDEYYDDEDDYKFAVTEKNKVRPSIIQYPTKNTLSASVSNNYKKPANHQTSNNYKNQYNNNFSNSVSKPPTQYQSFPQSGNLYRDEIRRPYSNSSYSNQRIPNTYQTHGHTAGGSNKVKNTNNNNSNKFLTSTSSKPIYHSSFKVTPTLDYDSVSPQAINKYMLQDTRPTSGTSHSNNKRPSSLTDYKTSSKYSDSSNKGYTQSNPTPSPKKRRPIPKPSPEMNDYYYDDEDEDDYYYEPPVKSKFMPSTEVKPQRPPIAQNYEEYNDYDLNVDNKRKPSNSKRPINNNETYDTDDIDDDDEEAQLKRPVKAKPTYQSTTDHGYSKYPNNINVHPTKTSILIPVKFDKNQLHPVDNSKPTLNHNTNLNQKIIKRPEIANYEVLHSTSNVPFPTKVPTVAVQKPRYLNQTTLRPYTVRHRLAKPSTTLTTYSDTRPNPTKQTTRQPTRPSQNSQYASAGKGTFKQPIVVSSTLKTDSENQETRHTDHDDNAPNRVEPVVSSSPSYTRQKGSGGRALYNTTSLQYDQHQQQYDPYYTLYDEDQELYKDADYAQQYNSASQRPSAQQPFRSTASPTPTPSTQHYTPSQASAYTPQHVSAEDYDDALINPDIDDPNQYQQPVRSSTTSTLDLINELGFGLSTLGGILRTSISPRVVSTASTTTTTTTTYSPPPPVTRAPVLQRSTTSESLKGNLDPPTERSETLVTKQPVVVVNNNRYSADSLKSQRLLLQTRRKQLRLLQNSLTSNNSHESQASEKVAQFVQRDSQPIKTTESTQHDSELAQHNSKPQHDSSESIQHNSQLHKSESTKNIPEPIDDSQFTQLSSNSKQQHIIESMQSNPESKQHSSDFIQFNPEFKSRGVESAQREAKPLLRRTQSKQITSTTEAVTQAPTQHTTFTSVTLERSSEAPNVNSIVSEVVNNNPLTILTTTTDIPSLPDKANKTSRFLSVSTGFSFRKDNVDNDEEPSYTLRVYKTPARIAVSDQSPEPEHNEVPESDKNAPKTSYHIEDIAVEDVVPSSRKTEKKEDVIILNNVIVSSERPKPITFVVENLPKPGQKPVVIQLRSQTGPRSHGPRIGPQDIVPIYNRASGRAFNSPSQDTFIYFKPSPQSRKEIVLNNHNITDVNGNNGQNKQKVLKTVIKRPMTTTESAVTNNEDQSDNDESDTVLAFSRQSSKSNLSKEVSDFVPKDDVTPDNNRRSNNIETLPNTFLRRKSFREVFNAKTESSLSNQPNVSPFKTLENLLKEERFDKTTPINRFQNNIVATTQDPRKALGRRNGPTPTSFSVDQQFEEGYISSVGIKPKEVYSRLTTTKTPPRSRDGTVFGPIAQNIIHNIYKLSSISMTQNDDNGASITIGDFDDDDSDTSTESKTDSVEKVFDSVEENKESSVEYSEDKENKSEETSQNYGSEKYESRSPVNSRRNQQVYQNNYDDGKYRSKDGSIKYESRNQNLNKDQYKEQSPVRSSSSYEKSSEVYESDKYQSKDPVNSRKYEYVSRNYNDDQSKQENPVRSRNYVKPAESFVSDKYDSKDTIKSRKYEQVSENYDDNQYKPENPARSRNYGKPSESYVNGKYDSKDSVKSSSFEQDSENYDNEQYKQDEPVRSRKYRPTSQNYNKDRNIKQDYPVNGRTYQQASRNYDSNEYQPELPVTSQRYEKTSQRYVVDEQSYVYEPEVPTVIVKEENKNVEIPESHVETPVAVEYEIDGDDEYEDYDAGIPETIYNIKSSTRPSYKSETPSTTSQPRTYPTTTTTKPTPSPSPETPAPITSTPETLWNRVTQRNRITLTETPNRSRGGDIVQNKYTTKYYEPTDTFNDVYKTLDDFNYDDARSSTEKDVDDFYPTVVSTAPSHASITTTTTTAKTTSQTTPSPVKSSPTLSRSNSFRSNPSSSVRTPPSSSPSTTLSPSGRKNRVNNDIKSKALASTRSYTPNNKCTDNSLQSKCNKDNNLQRTNTRGRGSAHYSTAIGGEQAVNTNRGTPPSANRARPTLKPSTSIVSKAQEFVDIYRFPPRRPENVYPTPQVDKTAAKCRKDVCLLPDCSCGGKDIPGNLPVEEVPQIVLITFDDAVNDLNKATYSELFERGRKNPNGCPISGTFYISHEWTDYSQVQNLYADGHEMASHTVSHSFGEQFSQKKWNREVGGQREILAAYGGVKLEDVRGMRAPFLSVGGNKMFKMLYDSNFTYDSSMPVYENRPPSWPYTLDYKLFHDCMIPPCPTKSYPGVWEVPMVMWQDLNGGRCSMGDACSNPPNAEGVYKMLLKNFDRHYTTNRAPFGLFYHAAWFTQPHHKEGFIMFLDTINAMKDVFLVTNWQAIQWVRDPTPLSRINSFQPFQCNYQDRPKRCNNPKVCNLWHKSGVRYMRTCQPCPDIYPWTGKTGIRSSRIDNEIEE